MAHPMTLSEEERKVLEAAVAAHDPEGLPLLQAIGRRALTAEEKLRLQLALGDELLDSGLHPNSEPNGRGLMIESIIDHVGGATTET